MNRTPAQKILYRASWATAVAAMIALCPVGLALVYATTQDPLEPTQPTHHEPASPAPTQAPTPTPEPTLEPVQPPAVPAKTVAPSSAQDLRTGAIPVVENYLGESPTYARVMSRWASPRRQ